MCMYMCACVNGGMGGQCPNQSILRHAGTLIRGTDCYSYITIDAGFVPARLF